MKESVRAVVINRQKRHAFFVQHVEWNPADVGKWSTIGGGIEAGDPDHLSCLKREIAEEFGIDSVAHFNFLRKLHTNYWESRTDHFYLAEYLGEVLRPNCPEEIENHAWFLPKEFRELPFFFGIEGRLAEEALNSFR